MGHGARRSVYIEMISHIIHQEGAFDDPWGD
jgi:hypothetical protein